MGAALELLTEEKPKQPGLAVDAKPREAEEARTETMPRPTFVILLTWLVLPVLASGADRDDGDEVTV